MKFFRVAFNNINEIKWIVSGQTGKKYSRITKATKNRFNKILEGYFPVSYDIGKKLKIFDYHI